MNKIKIGQSNIIKAIKLPIQYATWKSLIYALFVIVSAIAVTLKIYIVARFIDSLYCFLTKQCDISKLVVPCSGFVLIIIYEWLTPSITQLLGAKLKLEITKGVRADITESRAMLEYYYIESEKTSNLIKSVAEVPENRICNGFQIMVNSVALLVKTLGIVSLVFTKVWWGALLILIISAPLMKVAIKGGKRNYQVHSDLSKIRRFLSFLKKVLTERDYVNERTLFGYSDKINEEWEEQFEHCLSEEMKAKRWWYMHSQVGGIATTLVTLIVVVVLLLGLSNGAITIGLFSSTISGCMSLISNLTWQLPYYLKELTVYKEYVEHFYAFKELSKDKSVLCVPATAEFVFKSLEFRNVSFQYPGTNKKVLDQVSFKIEYGKHYAIVGMNGAGKSTIIKLIAGMYRQYSGDILLNGKNIKDVDVGKLKALLSIVFQDFAKYEISLKDNILIGDINHYAENEKNGKLEQMIQNLGLDEVCSSLRQGENTNLGKIHMDSVELSGGEWQRIAIARGEIGQSPLMVMDEPTAALDPISESELYQKFSRLNRGKTVLFISHRLGSIMMADKIILLDGGRIHGIGTHKELIETSELYADLYDKQRRLYK